MVVGLILDVCLGWIYCVGCKLLVLRVGLCLSVINFVVILRRVWLYWY